MLLRCRLTLAPPARALGPCGLSLSSFCGLARELAAGGARQQGVRVSGRAVAPDPLPGQSRPPARRRSRAGRRHRLGAQTRAVSGPPLVVGSLPDISAFPNLNFPSKNGAFNNPLILGTAKN